MTFAKFLKKRIRRMNYDRSYIETRMCITTAVMDSWLRGESVPPWHKIVEMRINVIRSQWEARKRLNEIREQRLEDERQWQLFEQEQEQLKGNLDKLKAIISRLTDPQKTISNIPIESAPLAQTLQEFVVSATEWEEKNNMAFLDKE